MMLPRRWRGWSARRRPPRAPDPGRPDERPESHAENRKPDEGYIHLIMDDKSQSMTSGLEDQIEQDPGTYLLVAEFVAEFVAVIMRRSACVSW